MINFFCSGSGRPVRLQFQFSDFSDILFAQPIQGCRTQHSRYSRVHAHTYCMMPILWSCVIGLPSICDKNSVFPFDRLSRTSHKSSYRQRLPPISMNLFIIFAAVLSLSLRLGHLVFCVGAKSNTYVAERAILTATILFLLRASALLLHYFVSLCL